MNIYFTTSLRSALSYSNEISIILECLKKNNYQVTLRPKLSNGIDVSHEKIDINNAAGLEFVKSGTSLQEIYLLTQKRITKSDIVIAEMSYGSTGLGYDVAQAIVQNKPLLVLNSDSDKISGNNAILGDNSKHISTKIYNKSNIDAIITEFINDSKKMLDSKFILIIPPEIERYLSWASNKKGIRKAEIVRKAIENAMDKDDDYKRYMNTMDV